MRGSTKKVVKAGKKVMVKKTPITPPRAGRSQPQKVKSVPKSKVELRDSLLGGLQAKREEIKETLSRLKNSRMEYGAQHTAGDFIDEVDDAQREISAHSQYSLIERKVRELQKVEQLILSIQKDQEFGLCEECGNPIPTERLLIMPDAFLCVPCQRETEKLDQKRSMAARGSSAFASKKEMDWESAGSTEEDENLLIEYHIGSMPMVELDENEVETPAEEKEEK